MRATTAAAADVSASRIAQADAYGKRKKPGLGKDMFGVGDGRTASAHYPQRNPAEVAEAERKKAEEDRKAGRSLVRMVMGYHACTDPGCRAPRDGESWKDVHLRHLIGGHGCAGPGCTLPGHDDAASLVKFILRTVDLAPQLPRARRGKGNYQWGRAPEAGTA